MILLCYQSSYMFQTSSNPHHIWFPILSNVAARKEKSGFQFPWRWNRWCNTDGREKDSFHFTVWRIVKCPGLHSRFAQCPTNASARRPARIYSWTRRTRRGNVGTWQSMCRDSCARHCQPQRHGHRSHHHIFTCHQLRDNRQAGPNR